MARRKKSESNNAVPQMQGVIKGAGDVLDQEIVTTIRENYMPYAMSVIMSRAIPEIDGFKPSHRKLLYTMYKMGLLNGARTKSANIVGQTMKLNPHGDSAIYDTMVRLSRGYEALLHPYVDSKGNFGKFYSRDMAWAASRYTEAKLDSICNELFKDIDRDTVDFVDNYDNTLKEPTLLPASYLCETTIALIKDKKHDIMSTLPAPDFIGGGTIIRDEKALRQIYETGRGSFKVRAEYTYDKSANCIDVHSIPPTATSETIIEKVIELAKSGKIKEISDIRDETGIKGLKITIDLKRGVDADILMQKLYKMTPLEDSFSCNFNVLIAGVPRVLGVRELLDEWTAFRIECIRRRTAFDLNKKSEKLHLLEGLEKILLDIDKAIHIVRETEEESDVVPNLMTGFGIDDIQAEYVAEIKLRHLNREYILNRTKEIESLKAEIEKLKGILESKTKVKNIIVAELKDVAKKYGKDRVSKLIDPDEITEVDLTPEIPDYAVNFYFTREGYFKKITPLSLRMSGEQKLKEGDEIIFSCESTNAADLIFFTNKCQVYKAKAYDFADTKASVLGDYIPAKLGMDEDEIPINMIVTKDYSGSVCFVFQNGKAGKVPLSAYETKNNRRKLMNAYSDRSPLVKAIFIPEDCELLLTSSSGRMLLVNTQAVPLKNTKNTQGVAVMKLKKGQFVMNAVIYIQGKLKNEKRYRTKSLPTLGAFPNGDEAEQLELAGI